MRVKDGKLVVPVSNISINMYVSIHKVYLVWFKEIVKC